MTIKGRVTIGFDVEGNRDLNAETDRLFRALLEVEAEGQGLSEADVMTEISAQVISASIVVVAESWSQAEQRAFAAFSEAIRRAGGEVVDEDHPATHDSQVDVSNIASEGLLHASVRTTELVPA